MTSAALDPKSLDNVTRVELLKEHQGKQGTFIKVFFANSVFNANGWAITKQALGRDLRSALDKKRFFGKTAPIILRDDLGHPPDNLTEPAMLRAGEDDRVGDFVDVGVDEATGAAWVIAEITSQKGKDYLAKHDVVYVSPSLRSTSEFHTAQGGVIVNGYRVNHLAIVGDPAFGMVAQIKAKCDGDIDHCVKLFKNVQASKTSDVLLGQCSMTGDTLLQFSSDDPISQHIASLMTEHPDWDSRQLVTAAINKQADKESLKGNTHQGKSMPEDDFDKLSEDEKRQAAKLLAASKGKQGESDKDKDPYEDDKDKQALKSELQATKKMVSDLQARIDTEVKTPLVEAILQAQVDAKLIETKDMQAKTTELMELPIKALQAMKAEALKVASVVKNATQESQNREIRYSFQGAEDPDKPGASVISQIRQRMGVR